MKIPKNNKYNKLKFNKKQHFLHRPNNVNKINSLINLKMFIKYILLKQKFKLRINSLKMLLIDILSNLNNQFKNLINKYLNPIKKLYKQQLKKL